MFDNGRFFDATILYIYATKIKRIVTLSKINGTHA